MLLHHLYPIDGSERTARRGRARMRVLVVEDNVDAARSTAFLMERYGFETSVALDGPAALQSVQENPPDVVLLDLGLPGMDGYEVARQVREQSRGKNPFFIAVTGYGRPEDRQRSQEAGIDLHLLKPVDPERLHGLLDRFARVVLPPQ